MNFPPFWARGGSGDFFCWRWSDNSVAEAQSLADAAARQLADRFEHEDFPPKDGGYYPNRPFREPVLHEIKNDAGERAAVVTRNSYGCLVLNTARVMFIDVDLPEPKKPTLFQKLFGKPSAEPPPLTEAGALAKVENWTRNNPDWGWRIYRTRAGLRLLATHALFDPKTAANETFDALGADPLYRKLCQTQKCFRARLTPKPWRCGVRLKPERWPFLDARAEKHFQKWEAQYQSMSFNWATCALVKKLGNDTVHPAVQPVLKLHDEMTKMESGLNLA